tara:strand:+ start:149 stop:337 length:189 start_codon:yes stop_codon:yes gene_type:complete
VNNPKKWLDVLARNRPKFCLHRDVLSELVRFKQTNRARLKNNSVSLSFASVFFGCSKNLDAI